MVPILVRTILRAISKFGTLGRWPVDESDILGYHPLAPARPAMIFAGKEKIGTKKVVLDGSPSHRLSGCCAGCPLSA